jgi:hypothetical protein
MVATCGGQEGANVAPCSAMPAPATDERHVLRICVMRDENCSVTCMTVATEVAIFVESVFHIFTLHAAKEESLSKADPHVVSIVQWVRCVLVSVTQFR